MDGNGRWATRQGLPRLAGHRAGIAHLERVVGVLKNRGVRYMTLYMFSTENWRRSKEEVDGIFELLADWLTNTGPRLRDSGVSLRHLGRRRLAGTAAQTTASFSPWPSITVDGRSSWTR
jgi:undecaprenyl diphosphate synthase